MIPTLRIPAGALVAVLWAATLSHAQQPVLQGPQTGTIVGTVLDISGGTVPNATVVLQEQNEHRSVVTGDNGFFTFNGINPDTPVQILVSASGLKSWTSNEISLQPGQSLILTDVTLGVAPVEISVNAGTVEEVAAEQVKVQEQQRLFGVIPNFYVTYERNAAPLTPKLKFQLALRTAAGRHLCRRLHQDLAWRCSASLSAAPGPALLLSRYRHNEIPPSPRDGKSLCHQRRRRAS